MRSLAYRLFLILMGTACAKQSLGDAPASISGQTSDQFKSISEQESQQNGFDIAGYTLNENNQGWLFFNKSGRIVYRIKSDSGRLSFLYPQRIEEAAKGTSANDSNPVVVLFGKPIFVVEERKDSGFRYRIVRVKPKLIQLSRFETKNQMELIRSPEGKARLQFTIFDDFRDFGQYSVNPKLVIAWNGQQLAPALQPAPREADLAQTCSSIKWEFQRWKPIDAKCKLPITIAPPRLAGTVLQFYYYGHSSMAKRLYDKCWVGNSKDKRVYWNFLMSILHKAKHWKEVRALNKM